MASRPTVRQPVKPVQPRPEAEDDEPSQGLPDAPDAPDAPEGEPPHDKPAAEYRTIADEQRERSLEIQRLGPTAYMAQFDTRTPEDMNRRVQGVGNTEVEEGALRAR
jgi:hypothetical protein